MEMQHKNNSSSHKNNPSGHQNNSPGHQNDSNSNISISIVIPVYNEAENIGKLFEETKAVCEAGIDGHPFDYEIIIVDDGSVDGTDRVCRSLSPLTYIRFRKNYGQTSALDCGFKAASKDLIAAMDGDGQNDPADIPEMIRFLMKNDLDVVSGWRRSRQDSFMKRFVSRGANLLRYMIIHDGIHDSGCTLKIYRRECFEDLTLFGEQHRFIPALLKIRGFEVGEMEVNHRPRLNGRSKYSLLRIVKGFLDMLSVWFWSKYASRPLYLLGGLSLVFFILAIVFGGWTVVGYFLTRHMRYFIIQMILAGFSFIAGMLLMITGLLGEMMMKTYFNTQGTLPYRVKEKVTIREGQDCADTRHTCGG